MANNQDLRIKVVANLDEKSSTKAIQDQLDKIAKNLNINVGIDDKQLKEVTKIINNIQNQASKQGKGIKIVDEDTLKTSKQIFTNVEAAVDSFKKFGQVKINKIFDPATSELKAFNLEIQKADGLIEKLKFQTTSSQGVNGVDGFLLTKREELDKRSIEMQKALTKTLTDRQRKEKELAEAQDKAINKNIELTQKEKQAQEELNKEIQRQLYLYQETKKLQAQDLTRRYADAVDKNVLGNQVAKLDVDSSSFQSLKQLRDWQDDIDLGFKRISSTVKSSSSHVLTFGEALKTAMVKFPIWMAASTIFFQSLRFFSDGISYVNELNKSLTEISVVTGRNQEEVSKLGEEYNMLAKEMGVLTQEITKASVEFYRQGLSQSEVMERVAKTTQYAKISNLDFKKSAEILTATVNSMGVGIERASDVFSYLGDATATGADEIGIAFQRVGGSAGALNVEFEKVSSWIAVLSSRTREGSATIGNSIKSLMARIQSLKENGFTEEDGTKVNQVAEALGAVNISLMDSGGNFRNFGTIMDELGSKWQDLDSRTKAYIATTVAGTYQQSRFLNLMEGYQDTIPLYEKSLESAGTTQQKYNLYLESTEAHLNKMISTWQGLWQSAFDSSVIRTGIDSLTGLATGVKNIVDTFGIVPPILTTVGLGFVLFNGGLKTTMVNGQLVLHTLKGLPFGFKTLDASMSATILKTRALNGTLATLNATANLTKRAVGGALAFTAGAILPVAGLMAVGFALQKLTEYIMNAKKEATALAKEQDTISKNYGTQRDVIDSLLSKHEQLVSIKKRSTEQEQEYADVSTKISQLMPNLVDHIDAYGQAHIKSGEALETELKYAKELVELSKQQLAEDYTKKFGESVDKRKEALSEIEDIQKRLNQKFDYSQGGLHLNELANGVDSNKLEMKLRAAQREFANANLFIRDQVSQMIKDILQLNNVDIDDNLQKQIQEVVKTFDVKNLNPQQLTQKAQDFSNAIADMQNKINTSTNGMEVQVAVNDVKLLAKQIGYTDDQAEAFVQTLIKQSNEQSNANDATQEGTESLEELNKKYKDSVSNIESLNGVLNDLNESHSVSSDKISFLMEKYPELLQYIGDETLLRKKVQEEIDKEAEVARQSMLQKLKDSDTFYDSIIKNNSTMVNQFATDYGIDLKNFANLAEAKAAIDNEVRKRMSKAWNGYYKDMMEQYKGVASLSIDGQEPLAARLGRGFVGMEGTKYFDQYQSALAIDTKFTNMISGFVKSATASIPKSGLSDPKKDRDKKSGSSSKSDKPPLEYVSSDYEKNLNKYNLQLDKSKAKLETLSDTSAEYRKELTHQQTIIKNLAKTSTDEINRLGERNTKLKSLMSQMGSYASLSNDEKELYNKRKKEFDDNEKTIQSLIKTNLDYSQSVTDINKSIKESKIKEATESQEKSLKKVEEALKSYQDQLEELDYNLSRSKSIQSLYEEGSSEWQTELANQNKILQEKIDLVQQERDSLQDSIRTEKLSADKKEELSKKVDELSLSYWDLKNAIKSNEDALLSYKESVADDVIDAVKKSYEQQRDIALAAIDDEIDALEKAHQRKLDLLDKEESARDHTKEMSKLNKERLQLQSKINVLALDNSQEAKAKRIELQKQLADLVEQIEEKQHDRSIDLQKEAIDTSYDIEKDALDDKRKATDRHYTELLNDERTFASMREQIIAGNLDNVQGLLGGFLSDFQSANDKTITEIGLSWQTLLNTIDAVKQAQSGLGSIPSTGGTETPTSGSTPSSSTGGRGRIVTGTFKNGLDASNLVDILQMQYGAENAKLSEDNGLYRVLADFSTLKRAEDVLNRLKQRKLIGTGRIEAFHEGGIVGGKGSRLAELANKLFNLNSGEQVIKSLNGELQIPPKNIPNIFKVMGNIMTSLAPQPSTSGGMGLEKLVHIENFYGTQKEVDNLSNTLVNKLKNKGIL